MPQTPLDIGLGFLLRRGVKVVHGGQWQERGAWAASLVLKFLKILKLP